MAQPPYIGLNEAEMVSLLAAQHEMIERLAARVSELEAFVQGGDKTSHGNASGLLSVAA